MMRVLFIMRHLAYLRLFESSLVALACQGHTIHLAFTPLTNKTFDDLHVRALSQKYPNISYETLPENHFFWGWKDIADWTRNLRDYLRYLDPIYANAPKLVRRKEKLIPPFLARCLRKMSLEVPNRINSVANLLGFLESVVPVNLSIRSYLKKLQPDVVAFTPILDGSNQLLDHMKAARCAGIPTVLCVASWDNLTNKGLIQIVPDKVTVWNNYQVDEAVNYHHVPKEKLVITGAQVFDDWFTREPSCSQQDFMKRIGLYGCDQYILYLCSSVFIAPREVTFIKRWLESVRNTTEMQNIGILIRPHPANIKQWQSEEIFAGYNGVTIWPRLGATPINDSSKIDYFDSLYHATAVVGINTSGMIEAGILSKPVFTILDDDFKDTQEGTIHFHHLVEGGLLFIGSNLSDHCKQLVSLLSGINKNSDYTERIGRFVADFVRPLGLDQSCAPKLASEIISTRFTTGTNPKSSILHLFFRLLLWVPVLFMSVKLRLVRRQVPNYSEPINIDRADSARPLPSLPHSKRKKKKHVNKC